MATAPSAAVRAALAGAPAPTPAAPRVLASAAPAGSGLPAGPAALSSAPAPAEALRLLDARFNFDSAAASRLLSDSAGDFRVLGALGPQGAGKSALLSALMGAGAPGAGAGAGAPGGEPPFAVGAAGATAHTTSRLELRLCPGDRTLLLDSPPLWSASWTAELLTTCLEPPLQSCAEPAAAVPSLVEKLLADARSRGAPSLPAEAVGGLLGLQTAALLLACCHVVVVMAPEPDDPRLTELLQVAAMVAQSLPDLGAAAAAAAGGLPPLSPPPPAPGGLRRLAEVVVVMTGVDQDALTVRHLLPYAELLRIALAPSRLLSAAPPEHAISILRSLSPGHAGGGAGAGATGATTATATAAAAAPSSSGEGPGTAADTNATAAGDSAGCGGSPAVGGSPVAAAAPPTPPLSEGTAAAGLSRPAGTEQPESAPAPTTASASGGGCSSLHFWALPRPLTPSALLPLRAALLGLPRRPLGGAGGGGPGVSEREWLRGVERLWGVELQASEALGRYGLALARDGALAGAGGWPLGLRTTECVGNLTGSEGEGRCPVCFTWTAAREGGSACPKVPDIPDWHWTDDSGWLLAESLNDALVVELQARVKRSEFISISLDDSTDISNKSFLAVHVYFMNGWEREAVFVDLAELREAPDAAYLSRILLSTLRSRLGLSARELASKTVGIGADGAGVMSGERTGVLRRMVDEPTPFALPIWDMAHRTNLAAGVLDTCPVVSKLDNLVSSAHSYHSTSAKRQSAFAGISGFAGAGPSNGEPLTPLLDFEKLFEQRALFASEAPEQATIVMDAAANGAKLPKGTFVAFWQSMTQSRWVADGCSEYVRLAKLVATIVPGSVEAERLFSTMSYIKDSQRNKLQQRHLALAVRMMAQRWFGVSDFPYAEALKHWREGAEHRWAD
ncbi:hypothetical protein HYH03_004299 [Edaphochlamys debaryana]|uniref:Uncharacterized protein n=1 Tax=Edaphochlamys debaryana TaxID=47281 RepID=A0A835Y754_9CHLO|nr:hypothetical protein HYH03_004299 [Edaphochlamys debaryana]|eukprot:KAG2497552.1 hypothetical protein HYH03_004299 [Edaphochlamys debaryana]